MDQQGYDGVEKGGRGAVMRGGRERSPQGRVLCAVLSPSVVPDSLPWTVACQAPLSLEFSRQEYWSGLPCPPPGDLPDPGIEPVSPARVGEFFTTSITWEAQDQITG